MSDNQIAGSAISDPPLVCVFALPEVCGAGACRSVTSVLTYESDAVLGGYYLRICWPVGFVLHKVVEQFVRRFLLLILLLLLLQTRDDIIIHHSEIAMST
eukprot:9298217-Pyramimonas_sp.AAC.1